MLRRSAFSPTSYCGMYVDIYNRISILLLLADIYVLSALKTKFQLQYTILPGKFGKCRDVALRSLPVPPSWLTREISQS